MWIATLHSQNLPSWTQPFKYRMILCYSTVNTVCLKYDDNHSDQKFPESEPLKVNHYP